MSTFSHSLQSTHAVHLSLVPKETDASSLKSKESSVPADDGLGCMRGLAVAMLFNAALILMIAGCWELWRLLR